MARFRKKPVVIEAEQFTYERCVTAPIPGVRVVGLGCPPHPSEPFYGEIETLEGVMRADEGDWIITGVRGEKYPCKPDIFAATYEPVEAPAHAD